MEIDVIIWALGKLETASLYRTPKDLQALGEPWFSEFRNMPEEQFKQAINKIRKTETSWPAISTIYKYAADWTESRKKDVCFYCEDTGFLLFGSKGINTAYACKCPEGKLKQKNHGIASFESLGIPWPDIEKSNFSKKMSKENRQLIDTFLRKIGEKIPEKKISEEEAEEKLWDMMIDGSLCESG